MDGAARIRQPDEQRPDVTTLEGADKHVPTAVDVHRHDRALGGLSPPLRLSGLLDRASTVAEVVHVQAFAHLDPDRLAVAVCEAGVEDGLASFL